MENKKSQPRHLAGELPIDPRLREDDDLNCEDDDLNRDDYVKKPSLAFRLNYIFTLLWDMYFLIFLSPIQTLRWLWMSVSSMSI